MQTDGRKKKGNTMKEKNTVYGLPGMKTDRSNLYRNTAMGKTTVYGFIGIKMDRREKKKPTNG